MASGWEKHKPSDSHIPRTGLRYKKNTKNERELKIKQETNRPEEITREKEEKFQKP